MKLIVVLLAICGLAFAQSSELGPLPKQEPFASVAPQAQQQASQEFSNHHILLVPSSAPGVEEAQFVAVSPTGMIVFVPVSQTKERLANGYRPFTFGELKEAINSVVTINSNLSAEVQRLRTVAPQQQVPSQASQEQTLAAMQAQADQQRRELRRQALLNFMLGMQRTNPPQTIDLNVRDCSRYPALCVH